MTSKESLEIIKKYDDFVMARYLMKGVLSPQTIGSPSKVEFDEAVKTIEKDLEVLEIIRKHKLLNYVIKNKKCATRYHLTDEELNTLKEIDNE